MIIPIKTLWTRADGWQIPHEKLRPVDIRMTFSGALGIPIPNPFGESHRRDYDSTVSVEGFSILIRYGEWSNGEILLHLSVLTVPEGGMLAAFPLVAIVLALAGATGLILLIILLSKIEAVLVLPLAWIIVGGAAVLALPFMIRNVRKVAPV